MFICTFNSQTQSLHINVSKKCSIKDNSCLAFIAIYQNIYFRALRIFSKISANPLRFTPLDDLSNSLWFHCIWLKNANSLFVHFNHLTNTFSVRIWFNILLGHDSFNISWHFSVHLAILMFTCVYTSQNTFIIIVTNIPRNIYFTNWVYIRSCTLLFENVVGQK